MLSELVYLSFRNPKCDDQEVDKILKSSVANNGKQDITGVLLYSKTKFLQVLEGEKEHIMALYDKIKTDKRHRSPVMLSIKPIMQRYFPSWQMAGKEIDTEEYHFLTDLTSVEKEEFKALLDGQNNNNASKLIARIFSGE